MHSRIGLFLCIAATALSSCRTPPATVAPVAPPAPETFVLQDVSGMSDDEFLAMIERDSVRFFIETAHPVSGLVAEDGHIAHVGSNGFALMALCIAAERGILPREEAAMRAFRILRTFRDVGSNWRGALWWITDAETATQNPYHGGFDIVESAYVSAGGLVCKQYFNGLSPVEKNVRDFADDVYRRVEFEAFLVTNKAVGAEGLAWSYDVEKNALCDLAIIGYHEGLLTYIMALGSPTHPIPAESWSVWTNGYTWVTRYGQDYYFCPALFTHQYPQVWLDLRDVQDESMRGRGITYFENSRRATLSHKAYAELNPNGYEGYGPIWGLTDCGCRLHQNGFGEHGLSWPWDIEGELDDGTVAVSAAGASVMFTPQESIAFLRHVYGKYGSRLYDRWGFRNAFNVKTGWVDTHHDALNKGAMVCAIANVRDGLIWKNFMKNPEVLNGLSKAGFRPISHAP